MRRSAFPAIRAITSILTFAFCCSSSTAHAQSDAILSDPLVVEAKRNWENYEATARSWAFRINRTTTNNFRKKRLEIINHEWIVKGNGHCVLLDFKDPKGLEPETCTVVGKEYEFKARKSSDESKWTITTLVEMEDLNKGIARGDYSKDDASNRRNEIECFYLIRGIAVQDRSANRLISSPWCQTISFAPLSTQAGALVEWKFKVDEDKRPAGMIKIQSGQVLFDPKDKWMIRESFCQAKTIDGISTMHYSYTYQNTPSGYPVPSEIRFEMSTDDNPPYTYITLVDQIEFIPQDRPLPDSAFTIEAYGIPKAARRHKGTEEQRFISSRKAVAHEGVSIWFYVIGAIGIVFVATSLYIRHMRRRDIVDE